MNYETATELFATYVFILTCLMTDNLVYIFISFSALLFAYGVRVGVNPLITIPKALLGRHTPSYLHKTIAAQLAGAALALLTYHFLIKARVITKHTLDRV